MADARHYFAYGSNADPERLRDRVGDWLSRRPGVLRDHRLRFADSVRSEGGGGAVLDAVPGATAHGVVYSLTEAQLAALDDVEFDADRDVERTGRRLRVTVDTADGPVECDVYTVEDDGGTCAPSERYLGHILRGLADAGCPDEALEAARRAARDAG